ncbi:unnamed protein product [Phytophthora fragariaefolia]|uniref:Unnamed protein product n=1 Tax=Phytophthora fragariaefolia TaxID=1490495 RepID=A0A9W6U266_9STRA|nr:unnamed protein product [Phytophthora fragariaefolia]
MLILLNIKIAELRQLIAQAATAHVSTHVVLSHLEGGALDLDVKLANREAELLGRHYLRVLNVSGLQKSTSPRELSVGEPEPKRIQHVPVLAPPSSIQTAEAPQSVSSYAFQSPEGTPPGSIASGSESVVKAESQASSNLFGMPNFSDESLVSATSASGTSRDSSSGYSGLGWDRDAGGHMLVVPMVMPGRTLGEETPVGPATDLDVTHATHLRIPVEVSQDNVTMSEPDQSQGRGRTAKTSRRSSKRSSSSLSGSSSREEDHRRRRSSRRSPSENTYILGRSCASMASGSAQSALNIMYQVQEALARMQTRQESALEKLNARVDLEVARRFGPQAQDAPEKPGPTPSPTEDAWVRRKAETRGAARLEAAHLERERADVLLIPYRVQMETQQADEVRRVSSIVWALQRELEDMRVSRAQERETAKNVQTLLN